MLTPSIGVLGAAGHEPSGSDARLAVQIPAVCGCSQFCTLIVAFATHSNPNCRSDRRASRNMIPEKACPGLDPGGGRLSDKDHARTQVTRMFGEGVFTLRTFVEGFH